MKNIGEGKKNVINNKKEKKNLLKLFNFKDLTYQEKLILALGIMGAMLLITTVINLLRDSKTEINYNDQSVKSLYTHSVPVKDRDVYWVLNDIISTFIDSYNKELLTVSDAQKQEILYSREDFYTVISDEYKKELSKKEYLEVSKKMLEKFIENDEVMKSSDFISTIKKLDSSIYSENMYICKLKTVDNSTESYIGIQVYPDSKSYNFFYLE